MTSTAPPETVIAGLIDFTERRPEIWPGLNPKMYRVCEVGDTWADVQEGTNSMIWARERYDWSTPGVVRWTVQESSFSTPGDFVEARITAGPVAGSRVHVTWSRRGKSLTAKIMVGLIKVTGGVAVRASCQAGLRRIEAMG